MLHKLKAHFGFCHENSKTANSWLLLLLWLFAASTPQQVSAWMPDVRPDYQPKQDKILARFIGNNTDYFKILDHDDASVLIGARDIIYNISLNGLRENGRLEWYSSDADRELCALKGKHEADCHNYLRVFARYPNSEQILLCGTNSYKPRCRNYAPTNNAEAAAETDTTASGSKHSKPLDYEIIYDIEAQGLCPYSPAHNSTYAFAEGRLYSATVADFSGSDPLIYRENLRTEQYDLKQLNQPDFVGAFEYDGFVLFFFREVAMEYMNSGKAIYSRVGRVCKNDRGGPYTLAKSWTSFLKARLNCSMPGDIPFYFDEIQAISSVITSAAGNNLIYAVFTTSINAISGSAVCAFDVAELMSAFEGRFKSQKDSQSQWLPVPDEQVPEPRPGQCVEDSRMLSSIAVNFAKNHPLMETAVQAVYERPLLTKVNLHHRLTSIAIEPQVQALNGAYYDVIYVGTDDGKVTKFFYEPMPQSVEKLRKVLISEMQVLPLGTPVRELMVSSSKNSLLVVSDGALVTVTLHRCALILDCMSCLSLQDPSCAWDQQNQECKNLWAADSQHKFGTKTYLQSLNGTKKAAVALCPKTVAANKAADGIVVGFIAAPLPQAADEHLLSKKLHYNKVGNAASDIGGTGTDANTVLSAAGADYLPNSFLDENHITQHAVDPDDIMNTFSDPLQSTADVEQQNLQLAGGGNGKGVYWGFGLLLLVIVFLIGLILGLWSSRNECMPAPFHVNSHHNQLNSNAHFGAKHHNSGGKDINLLISSVNQKKANLVDLEKDRSHECKNSSENLEKELPCKTSTLTKVKRTYI